MDGSRCSTLPKMKSFDAVVFDVCKVSPEDFAVSVPLRASSSLPLNAPLRASLNAPLSITLSASLTVPLNVQ